MKTAFLCVDAQYDFMNPEGKLYVKKAETLLPAIADITFFAMRSNIPVVASMDMHVEDDPEFKMFPPHCVALTPGAALVKEAGMGVGLGHAPRIIPDVIITKQTYDMFSNPLAEAVIKAVGAKKWYVYGVATEYCVLAAVLGLRRLKYRVDVFADAIMGVADSSSECAITKMQTAGANFVSSNNVIHPHE